MLKRNRLQFAVVREDPEVELALFDKFRFQKPILIGSGGCTAFALAAHSPGLPIALIEPNPAQIDLIRTKRRVLTQRRGHALAARFGVGVEHPRSLIEGGNFETLFRGLRRFIFEFIADRAQIARWLCRGRAADWKRVFQHPYWPVGFDLYFSNSLLLTMFGPAAIQHGPAESYARYFREVFKRGLLRADRADNYFLHHLLLGHYPRHREAWPSFLRKPPATVNLTFFRGLAQEFKDYAPYDFVGLSNIFDWSSGAEVRKLAGQLRAQLRPDACVVFRQLNNGKDFRSCFGASFTWLDREARALHRRDRSLFYSSLHIARKIK